VDAYPPTPLKKYASTICTATKATSAGRTDGTSTWSKMNLMSEARYAEPAA
jgi:hypothetical protein